MPTLAILRHGFTLGTGNPNAKPPHRTACAGWSSSAIRRNTKFLRGVDERPLEQLAGMAFTLTVKTCPPGGADWTRARHAFLQVLHREGVHLVHWVTEWQARAVPHMHLSCYWSPETLPDPRSIIKHWLRIAAAYGAQEGSQNFTPIYDIEGWNKYSSKHAARGLRHYQRSPENVPPAWRGASTGQMWGKRGNWPMAPVLKFKIGDGKPHHVFRRLVRAWRIADARARSKGRGRAISAARRMLACPLRSLSGVRGCSEWASDSVTLSMALFVAAEHGEYESI